MQFYNDLGHAERSEIVEFYNYMWHAGRDNIKQFDNVIGYAERVAYCPFFVVAWTMQDEAILKQSK